MSKFVLLVFTASIFLEVSTQESYGRKTRAKSNAETDETRDGVIEAFTPEFDHVFYDTFGNSDSHGKSKSCEHHIKCTKPNEIFDPCDAPCPQRRCDFDSSVVRCMAPPKIGSKDCVVGCRCIDGYLRDSNNVCIPKDQCKKCKKPNEVYDKCPKKCPFRTCGIDDRLIDCAPPKPGEPECLKPTCRCKDQFFRDDKGNCVPWDKCPKCKNKNEVYDPCDTRCPERRCDFDLTLVLCEIPPTIGDKRCVAGCRCEDGFLRNSFNVCIPREQCPPKCQENEVASTCVNGGCQKKKCSDLYDPDICVDPLKCESGCLCADGYLRADNGTCVPKDKCYSTPCPTNEEFSGCSNGLCRVQDCKDKGKLRPCPPMVPGSCIPGCVCKENFLRQNGSCIPQDQCPITCKANEVFSTCINGGCQKKNCSDLYNPTICKDPKQCIAGCLCAEGYLRDPNGTCIPQDKCYSAPCPTNEEFSGCSNGLCRVQACKDKGKLRPCPPMAPGSCIPGCVCKENFLRQNGSCIPQEQCPITCKANEVYSTCINGGCQKKNCSDLYNPTICIDPKECVAGCLCAEGYLRDPNGTCIPQDQCYSAPCPSNEEFSGCSNGLCRVQDCKDKGKLRPCPPMVPGSCIPGCVCKENFLRQNGSCIPQEQCPITCKANEVYSTCINGGCQKKNCSDLYNPTICVNPKQCVAGCLCADGYLRDPNGTCIPQDKCYSTPCPTNEEFSGCSNGLCRVQACKDKGKLHPCPPMVPGSCIPGCVCKENFLRQDGSCIPQEQCPITTCNQPNEVYDPCPDCSPQTCKTKDKIYDCPMIPTNKTGPSCKPACRCQPGYFRNLIGNCILASDCDKCPGDHEYFSCGGACDNVCATLSKQNQTNCPIVNIVCNKMCYCEKGYARAANKTCVPFNDCKTNQCQKNEELSNCANGLCRVQKCEDRGKTKVCPPMAPGSCISGCVCKDKFLRKNGTCVPETQCPISCPEGEIYSDCPPKPCDGEYCPAFRDTPQSCPISNPCDEGRCVCGFNSHRDPSTNKCIPTSQCRPFVCEKPNEVYDACPPVCPGQNCSDYINNSTCPKFRIGIVVPCKPECRCKEGYYRDPQGNCISGQQCKATCTKTNEVYDPCPDCSPQTCASKDEIYHCPMIPANKTGPNCKPACRCKQGYLKNSDGNCIPASECLTCNKPNEVYDPCPDCTAQTCKTKDKIYNCPMIPVNKTGPSCKPACRCQAGYFRNLIGECILASDCDKCPADHEYFSCGGACDNVCATLSKQNQTNCPIVNIVCNKMCYCEKGYARAANNTCVPFADCKTNQCQENEELSNCANGLCRVQKCEDRGKTKVCPPMAPGSCISGCVCKDKFLRKNGTCVPETQCPISCPEGETYSDCPPTPCEGEYCPAFRDTPQSCPISNPCDEGRCVCGFNSHRDPSTNKCIPTSQCRPFACNNPNEVYDACPPPCPGQNCSDYINNSTCPKFKIGIVVPCKPACRCKEGYYRDIQGNCVSGQQCQVKQCQENEELSNCANGLCRVQKCEDRGKTKVCPPMAPGSCISGCVCKDKFLRKNGTCVPETQCPISCPQGEIYSDCPPKPCDGEYCPAFRDTPQSCPISNPCDKGRCICGFNSHRDPSTNKCIPTSQCRPFACNNPNEVYDACPPPCPGQNCTDYINNSTCPKFKIGIVVPCKPACRCKEGYYRDIQGNCVTGLQCKGQHNFPCAPKNKCNDVSSQVLALEKGNIGFTGKFLYQLAKAYPGESVIASALSVLIPLAQLALYSLGNTYSEIMKVLNLKTKDEIRCAFPSFLDSVQAMPGTELDLADKIYVSDKYNLSKSFKNDVVNIFNGETQSIDFNQASLAADIINKWVSVATKGKITELVVPTMFNSRTRLVLTNAIYFKGTWKTQFNAKNTKETDFYVNAQKTVKVQMMTQKSKFNYAQNSNLNSQIVELPYQDGNITYVVILPNDKDGLANVIDRLQDPDTLNNALNSLSLQTVTVYLPKQDVSTKTDLIDILKPIGISTVFGNKAQLRGMVVPDELLYVSDAVQKAVLKLDEKGSEAAAANAVVISTRALPRPPAPEYIVRADHQFAYFIKIRNTILFCGIFTG